MIKKPFRFGIVTDSVNLSRSAWIALAQRAEELGYATLHLPDSTPQASLTSMAVAATATTTLRVGSFVFVNDYRNPALLAREIATLDRLSDGRVEMGLGAGNWPLDFQQLGIPFEKAAVRFSRFQEGFSIIKAFFSNEVVNFSGNFYTVKDLQGCPTSVQRPHPPIFIGSGGRRMLTLAACEADIIAPIAQQPEEMEEKIGWIQETAGERFEHLTFSQSIFNIELTDSPVAASPLPQGGIQGESLPMTREQAIEYLEQQREKYGLSYFYLRERQIENFAPVLTRLNGKE
jgi:probable F420-dependent oxidoreductase